MVSWLHCSYLFIYLFMTFWDTVSLCSWGWPRTHSGPPTAASHVLELRLCANTPGFHCFQTCDKAEISWCKGVAARKKRGWENHRRGCWGLGFTPSSRPHFRFLSSNITMELGAHQEEIRPLIIQSSPKAHQELSLQHSEPWGGSGFWVPGMIWSRMDVDLNPGSV